eukprot:SAG25_NODE_11624_length_300_cov_0.517413_1_plen_40_part_10
MRSALAVGELEWVTPHEDPGPVAGEAPPPPPPPPVDYFPC